MFLVAVLQFLNNRMQSFLVSPVLLSMVTQSPFVSSLNFAKILLTSISACPDQLVSIMAGMF
jgi:hypothetical protein